jgi:hypothetical protein
VNYADPELVRIITTPSVIADILGEGKKGDWVTKTATFPVIESTGEVSSYGDRNNNGVVNANVNFEPRQSYTFQGFVQWGDMELEEMGMAKIDWAAEKNVSLALVFEKTMNYAFAFGVTGLENYGLLNDPALPAALTPITAVWASCTGIQIWADIQDLYKQLVRQTGGNVTMQDELILALDPMTESYLLTPTTNVYGNATVKDLLKESFPRLTVKTAMEYATLSGNLVQLIAPRLKGQRTGMSAFTEKMRAHAIVRDTSTTYQKKSAGVWGTIIKQPIAIASKLGV